MGFTEKTNYLLETKSLLKDRINSLGGSITSGTTFRDYLVWLDSLYEALDEKTITGLPDSLEGKCEQSGTPTPTTPQPINITTGRQVVSVCGKNLFDKNNANILSGYYLNFNQNKILSASGTATLYISIKGGETYTISKRLSSRFAIATTEELPSNNVDLFNAKQNNNATSLTITTSTNAKYLCVFFLHSSDTLTEQQILDSIQIEKGNQATTYEEYIGQDYEINLGKQLFDIDGTVQAGTLDQYNNGFTLIKGTNRAIRFQLPQILPAGTYTLSYDTINDVHTLSDYFYVSMQYGSSYTNVLSNVIINNKGATFTTTSAFNWLYFFIRGNEDASSTITIDNVQLEKGSVASSFSPYKSPIYLGKIGNYKDYIFRNTTENPLYDSNLEEGQWYIHKEIGRVVLNGSETEWGQSSVLTNTTAYNFNKNIGYKATTGNSTDAVLNYFTGVASGYSVDQECFWFNSSGYLRLRINTSTASTIAKLKTWLASNNVEVYYVLNTPTNTLIEDEELINQLNSIELLDGLNNVSITSPYLPFIMSLMYNYQEGYTEEDMLFCGVVENTGNISLNPRHPHYCNLQVLDFKTFLSEGETLDFVIYEKTILEAINQVIGTISDYGFVLGNVNILHEDDVIGAYSTKDKTAYDVFNYIADITQSRWSTRMIDENTVAIDFYDPSLMPQGTSIDYTQEWFCDNNIIDMSFSYSSRDYRNKQVMLSGEVYANIETTGIIVADGYQTQFNTTGKIGYVSSLLLNGNPATIITKEEYDLGYEGDFVYQPGNTYFESVNLVSTGAIITIVYFAIIEGREVVLNQEEISRVSEMIDRKGVIARYENRNDATTTQELQAIGQSYLKYKGNPEVLLKVETLNNIWNIGERVEFDSPLEELTTEYMVKKKTINYITTQEKIFYTYELSSSFNSETEINYFDNQRSKMMGNIGAGEYISRNIDIENTANVIFYDLEVNEVVIDGNSTLQSELQTPLGVE